MKDCRRLSGPVSPALQSVYALWNARPQSVSIGVTINGFQADLVPGKVQEGYQNYHSLWVSKRCGIARREPSGSTAARFVLGKRHRLEAPSWS